MEYRKIGNTIYARMDKGDELIAGVLSVCRQERILSAVFSGIGGFQEAAIQTFIPESGQFETQTVSGMLEMLSVNGNIITDEGGNLYPHAHAAFSYKDGEKHCVTGGHLRSATVLYTAEIEIRPVVGGVIKRKPDAETGTGFWQF